MNRLLPLALGLLALAPAASAGWFDDPVAVTLAPWRAGDLLRYATGDGAAETLVLVEGAASTLDGYGLERRTVALRVDETEAGQLVTARRCHLLEGGGEAVRVDHLAGHRTWVSTSAASEADLLGIPLQRSASVSNVTIVASFQGSCTPLLSPRATAFAEGERRRLSEFETDLPPSFDAESEPALAAEFHGRAALTFVWTLPETPEGPVTLEVTLADGLPGVARVVARAGGETHRVHELLAYVAGDGAVVELEGDARLPERNPAGRFAPLDLLPDAAAFELPYPLEEAVANLRADARTGLAAYLAAHPDARAEMLHYDRDMKFRSGPADTGTDGGWYVAFRDGASTWSGLTVREAVEAHPAVAVPDAAKPVYNVGGTEARREVVPGFAPFEGELVDASTVAALAAAQGLDVAALRQVSFYAVSAVGASHARWVLTDVADSGESGRAAGRLVEVDAARGGLVAVGDKTVESTSSGLLAPPGASLAAAPGGSAIEVLGVPAAGLGLAGGAAVAVGLLALFAKLLLVPLFTRLRRDRLLDNPVRARLYERVRAEPGIHLAALTDFAGIGEGATRHHLAQLRRHRLLVEVREGGYLRYFAAGEVPPDVARREALLRAGAMREVYDLYAAEPRLSLREAARRLGMSAPSVYRYRKRLEKAGLVPAAGEARVERADA